MRAWRQVSSSTERVMFFMAGSQLHSFAGTIDPGAGQAQQGSHRAAGRAGRSSGAGAAGGARGAVASHVLGRCLRRSPRDWQGRYGLTLVLVETFVDTSCHVDTCHRAANWRGVGDTQGRGHNDPDLRQPPPATGRRCVRCGRSDGGWRWFAALARSAPVRFWGRAVARRRSARAW
ncbi:MAG: DUF4338 domain-containing protein [Chromatiaceae bacterium]|nr:MAG: DUF4338 domain-containing protein [Chromatiaceae bacterium]